MANIVENDIPVGEIAAYVTFDGENYFVKELDGSVGDACKVIEDGKTIALTPNGSGRQWIVVEKVQDYMVENHTNEYPLTKRGAKRVIGTHSLKDPNEAIAKYLPEDLKAEYDAIIARAREAYAAAHPAKAPKTEVDKLKDKLAKSKAILQELIAANPDDEEAQKLLAALEEI